MASPAPTPLANTAAITSPFLKLAPELRNRIYEHTFAEVKKTGIVPHPLTHTNKQIRNECRAMYYASIECIEITLRTTSQYNLTKRWLDEEDWSMYPVLPDITILTYDGALDRDVTISCRRKQITPAREFALQLAQLEGYYISERERLRTATMDTYTKCLGFDPEDFALEDEAPEAFTRVIRGGDTWSIRRMEYDKESIPLLVKFRGLAEGKMGHEWDQHDLGEVVKWLYIPISYRERRMGSA